MSSDGNELFRINDIVFSYSDLVNVLRINHCDNSCYVLCFGGEIRKYSSSGELLGSKIAYSDDYAVDVNTYDNTVWLLERENAHLSKLTSDLKNELMKIQMLSAVHKFVEVDDGEK